jgi:hypothetical protein
MNDWHTACLGLKRLPSELTAFEIEALFNFSPAERRVIEERRGPELMLGLALQIGFLRMSGRLLEAVRVVPPALWRYLGQQSSSTSPPRIWRRCARCTGAGVRCSSTRTSPARCSSSTR